MVWSTKLLSGSGNMDFRLNGAKLHCVFSFPRKNVRIEVFPDKCIPDKRGFTLDKVLLYTMHLWNKLLPSFCNMNETIDIWGNSLKRNKLTKKQCNVSLNIVWIIYTRTWIEPFTYIQKLFWISTCLFKEYITQGHDIFNKQ